MKPLEFMKVQKIIKEHGHCFIIFDKRATYAGFAKLKKLNRKVVWNPNSEFSHNVGHHGSFTVEPITMFVKVIKITQAMIGVDPNYSDVLLDPAMNAFMEWSSRKDRAESSGYLSNHIQMKRHGLDKILNVQILGENPNGKKSNKN